MLPGVHARMWWRNPETGMCAGVLRWNEGPLTMWQVGQASAHVAAVCHPAYGANYPRLQALKARYDPTNLFRMNINIRPAD